MNTPVSFEIAKLLKEKGFDEPCNQHYSQALFEGTNPNWEGVFPKYSVFKHSDYHYNSISDNNDLWFKCSAPTIAEVVMWLYEKHGIWINPQPFIKQNQNVVWIYNIFKDNYIIEHFLLPSLGVNSPTEAYEAAITYALNNLI